MPDTIHLLSPRALVAARSAFLRSLPDLCNVLRPTYRPGASGTGGTVPGPVNTVATVPARLLAMTGNQETLYADILGTDTGWQVFLPFQPGWLPHFGYGLGMVVSPRAGTGNAVYRCTGAGTSGAGEPVWPGLGNTVTDGGVTWTGIDPASGIDVRSTDRLSINGHVLEIIEITTGQTWQIQTVVVCAEKG